MKRTEPNRAKAIMLMLLIGTLPNCQSDQGSGDEELRENMRMMIEVIERAQQDLAAQREVVELHEKLKTESFDDGGKLQADKEREQLERRRKEYGNGWQEDSERNQAQLLKVDMRTFRKMPRLKVLNKV